MNNPSLLVVAMAEQCRSKILGCSSPDVNFPSALQPKHLLWMCDRIDRHAEDGPPTKLHRWIGFVQCAMLAQGILDLDGLKSMFDNAKIAHGYTGEDLLDHLDPLNTYEMEIGGEG